MNHHYSVKGTIFRYAITYVATLVKTAADSNNAEKHVVHKSPTGKRIHNIQKGIQITNTNSLIHYFFFLRTF